MKLLDRFRQDPYEKIDAMFWRVLPSQNQLAVLSNAVFATAQASGHTADRIAGPVIAGCQQSGSGPSLEEWFQVEGAAMKTARLGMHAGYIVADRMLSSLQPEEVLAVEFPKCERSL